MHATDLRQEQRNRPPQHQPHQPGREHEMRPRPVYIRDDYRGAHKLDNRIALITGGDSGIGRAIAVHYAREGAHVAIVYLEEHRDAEETKRLVEAEGRRCLAIAGDVADEGFCYGVRVPRVGRRLLYGRADIAPERRPLYRDLARSLAPSRLAHGFRGGAGYSAIRK